MNIEYLIETYGYNEPIFLADLKNKKISDTYLRQIMKRLVDDSKVNRFDEGIFYIPKPNSLLKKTYFDTNKVIISKYVSRNNRIFGYFSGFMLANQMGLTTQMPVKQEIVSNNESSKGRDIMIKNKCIRIKKPRVSVNNSNVCSLQLLDVMTDLEKYSELDKDEQVFKIEGFIQANNIKRNVVIDLLKYYPDKVSTRLIESRLVYALA